MLSAGGLGSAVSLQSWAGEGARPLPFPLDLGLDLALERLVLSFLLGRNSSERRPYHVAQGSSCL